MAKHELDRREYGSRCYETRTIANIATLAERILADLPPAGTEPLPAGLECSIHVLAGVLLQLQVGGLRDDFTFYDRISHLYSRQALDLIGYLIQFLESYNWTNEGDLMDRRFFVSVYLLAESEYRSDFWIPGVLRVF